MAEPIQPPRQALLRGTPMAEIERAMTAWAVPGIGVADLAAAAASSGLGPVMRNLSVGEAVVVTMACKQLFRAAATDRDVFAAEIARIATLTVGPECDGARLALNALLGHARSALAAGGSDGAASPATAD